MKCPKCNAYMTQGGTENDPVGTRVECEAMAWANDTTVKCWRCGYEYKPTMKPSDRKTQLKMNPKKHSSLIDFYGAMKRPWESVIRGRRVA